MVKKRLLKFAAVMLLGCMTQGMQAQDDLLVGKPIYPLGEPMTWTSGDASYTFITEDLEKLVATPTNTSNVFLYPENGAINTQENQEKGAQPFYIDMGKTTSLATVTTTWEGAAADSYNIFLTDEEPTLTTLTTTPAYSVSGLGQYTANTAILPDGSKGRYLVFQVTKATNWGWGVKIRSISAYSPVVDELTTFTVSPGIVMLGHETPMTITMKNQLGVDISPEVVELEVSGDATFTDGVLTINSGDKATFTATMDEITLTADVYAITAPRLPEEADIKTPIYTNTNQEKNSSAEFVTDWNGGATKIEEFIFEDGKLVAQGFLNTQCVFFSNKETTGAWNDNINPAKNGYGYLKLDVFATKNVQGRIEFESTEDFGGIENIPISLIENQWNTISIDVAGVTKLNNLSIRFEGDENICDIALANIYFTAIDENYIDRLYIVGTIEGLEMKEENPTNLCEMTYDPDTKLYTTTEDFVLNNGNSSFYFVVVNNNGIIIKRYGADSDNPLYIKKKGEQTTLVNVEKAADVKPFYWYTGGEFSFTVNLKGENGPNVIFTPEKYVYPETMNLVDVNENDIIFNEMESEEGIYTIYDVLIEHQVGFSTRKGNGANDWPALNPRFTPVSDQINGEGAYEFNIAPYSVEQGKFSGLSLEAGYYDVIFDLSNDNGNTPIATFEPASPKLEIPFLQAEDNHYTQEGNINEDKAEIYMLGHVDEEEVYIYVNAPEDADVKYKRTEMEPYNSSSNRSISLYAELEDDENYKDAQKGENNNRIIVLPNSTKGKLSVYYTKGSMKSVEKEYSFIVESGEPTEVEAIESVEVAEPVYYNLMGIRVNPDNLTNGIYIVNGKKVIIRR